jgi:hypothetical protein
MVVLIHIVGPPDYDYVSITDKLIAQFGDTFVLKYVEDLWAEYSQLAKVISEKTYRQFLTRHGLATGRQRPIVYIGGGGNPYMDDYLHIGADYKFYVDISPQSIASRNFRIKLAQWVSTLNADDILPRLHANESAAIAELTNELETLLTLSVCKSTLVAHRNVFTKAQYTLSKSGKVVEHISKILGRTIRR